MKFHFASARIWAIVSLMFLALIATACSPAPPVELVIAIPEDLPTYDPFFAQGDLHTPGMLAMLFDNLIERDEKGQLVPSLAETWTWVDDTTLELVLRQGVTFHNGEVFDADAVKFSVERMLDPDAGVPVANAYGAIDSVEIIDSYTVRLHLNRVDSQLVHSLSTFLTILPPDYFAEVGAEEFGRAPVGTGPYKFTAHVRDEYATFTAFADYYEGSWKGTAVADTVTFRFIPEVATRIAELETGTIDIAVDIPNDKVAQVEALEGVRAETGEGTLYYMLLFAFKADVDQPFDDLRVRQALAMATDVQVILDNVASGYGTVLAGPFTAITTGADDSIQPWAYDLDSALDLMDDAGFADGFDLTIDVAANVPLDIVQAVAGQWQALGVDVEVNPMEVGAFNDAWMGKTNNDMLAVAFNTEYEPGSHQFVFICDMVISYYCNDAFDTPFNQGVGTLDDVARAQAYGQAFTVLHDDLAGIYLFSTATHWGMSDQITQFVAHPSGWVVASQIVKNP